MYEGITVPSSREVSDVLYRYCGGFMYFENVEHYSSWGRLLRIDKDRGLIIGALATRPTNNLLIWHDFLGGEGVPCNPEGIIMFDRGGPFVIFGDLIMRSDEVLAHVYYPFDRNGEPLDVLNFYVNHFYPPGSKEVPEEVIASYDAFKKSGIL